MCSNYFKMVNLFLIYGDKMMNKQMEGKNKD